MTITDNTKHALARRLSEGLSTLQIGDQKQRLALDWLYRWWWSWPDLLEQVGGAKGNRLTSRLEKNNLVTTMVPAAAGIAGMPRKIVVLTQAGLQEAERFQSRLMKYELDPYRVRQSHIRHGVLCQKATVNMLGEKFLFETEREMADRSLQGVKQPDVAWLINGLKVAVEVEISAKWDRHFDQFILSTIRSLMPSQTTPARFDRVLLFTDSPAIRDRYQHKFRTGELINHWAKDGPKNTDKWKVVGQYKVPTSIEGRVICQLFE
jgi:DNA-binding PadR family transcriptional regulator